jgi:glycosyltransferase involved in cell wall biosynthesis
VRICVIASSRFPIAQPFAGGLEAWTHGLVRELHRRGHDVTLFAAPGTDLGLPVATLPMHVFEPSPRALADVHSPPMTWMHEHHAYLGLMLSLGRAGAPTYDVIHNSSLHHLPVAMASALPAPMVTTLHTPPVPWLESAVALAGDPGRFVAVSEMTAAAWSGVVRATVIRNGVDTTTFRPGPGGGPAVWTGRMVPEKAPHEAIDAARLAGIDLVLAGPMSDPVYVAKEVQPRLGDGCSYAGHLRRNELADLLGSASLAFVTPAWDEPYGLVAAEAMACGTPVAAYARGALAELVTTEVGELAPAGDVAGLAAAAQLALTCDRAVVRAHAEAHCSQTRMIDEYEQLYMVVTDRSAA